MRTAVLGGSFDPLHIGHLFLAEELKIELGYERVILVPAAEPPHKRPSGETTSAQRLEMLAEAVSGIPELVVDDCEILRGGRSYTIQTIPLIREKYDLSELPALVVGDDLLEGFSSWKDHEELVEMVNIVVAHRLFSEEVEFGYPHQYLHNLILPVSSSGIRERVASGRAFRHIVPESVFRYIQKNMLYRRRNEL